MKFFVIWALAPVESAVITVNSGGLHSLITQKLKLESKCGLSFSGWYLILAPAAKAD